MITFIIICVTAIHLGARLGLPTYSLVTGLGIGGLAVALAGREALSNVVGTLIILLDKPFRRGDFIVLGDGERGTVHRRGAPQHAHSGRWTVFSFPFPMPQWPI